MRTESGPLRAIFMVCAFVMSMGYLHAQPNTVTTPPCNDAWCKDAEYNYMFCDPNTGTRFDRCSKDPNNEPMPGGGCCMKVMKRALPLRLCPDFSNLRADIDPIISFPVNPDPTDPHNTPVFVNDHMIDRLREAVATWERLCPPQGPSSEYNGECCLAIEWTNSDFDMGNSTYLENAAAVTHIERLRPDPSAPLDCRTDCAESHMYVNQQLTHTRRDERGRPKFFVSTEPFPWAAIPADQGYQYVYAYSLFLHELGHWLGFSHSDAPDKDEKFCEHPGSIMDVSAYPQSWIIERRDIGDDDICMFKKLYCCESMKSTADIDAPGQSLAFTIVPNPSQSWITLQLPATTTGRLVVRLVDARGVTLHETQIEAAGERLTFDVSGIPSGSYMLTVSNGPHTYGERVNIQH